MKYLQKRFLVDIYLRFSGTSLRQSGTFNFSFVPQNIWNKTFKVFIALIKLVLILMHPIPLRNFLKGTEWGHRKMFNAILKNEWIIDCVCITWKIVYQANKILPIIDKMQSRGEQVLEISFFNTSDLNCNVKL